MRTVIVLIGICLAINASAGNITIDLATRAAKNYLSFMTSANAWDGVTSASATLERTLEWNDETIGYYFEVNPDGYLLIPAFRELPPIKAYSEHGRVSFDHPESYGAILESVLRDKAEKLVLYSDLASMADDGIDTSTVNHYSTLWEVFTEPDRQSFLASLTERELDEYIPGTVMLTSVWHQSSPYNNYCPLINNQNCLVGCVATATTQVMRFWEWPPEGEGSHSYLWQNQQLYADFSDSYDWENILDSYNGYHTAEEMNAVAELSYEVGVAFEMNYGVNSSSATTSDAVTVLTQFFRYDDSIDRENRVNYPSTEDWFDMLQEDLDHDRPMIYRIQGHAIVSDGWQIVNTISFIHFNYGWGGSNNAWFALDEIPGSDDPDEEYAIRRIIPFDSGEPPIQWQAQVITQNFIAASSVFATDVDGDGDTDVLGSAYIDDAIMWWENLDGEGTIWSEHLVDEEFNGSWSVYAADVDGDGDTDILGAATNSNSITWWENLDGTGVLWTEHTVDDSFDNACSVHAADVDGDGDMDILGAASNDNDITWWENLDGTGTTWPEHPVDGGFNGARSVHTADMDGDGDLDVLGAAYDDDDITWWENSDGSGLNWSEHTVDGEFDGAYCVHAADVDGDGDIDVLGAAKIADELGWWENVDGTGTNWTGHTVDALFNGANCVYPADLDGDGDIDILGTAYDADDITWWENHNDIFGRIWIEHRINGMFDGASSVYAMDLDGDGDNDVLGAAYFDHDIMIWLQVGSPGPPDPVVITITPSVYPTIIPRGGWLEYDLQMNVNIDQPANGYVWTMATLPNGQSFGPIFDVPFAFMPGMSITVEDIQQSIVSYAPLGTYEWIFNAGPNLLNPVGSDSFPFTVVAANSTSDRNVTEWTSLGHEHILIAAGADAVIAEDPASQHEYSISQVYPNPFNSTTSIAIVLPNASDLTVTVFNVMGQQVADLADGSYYAGTHQFTFDASGMASGLYFIHAMVPGQLNDTQKVMLVR